MVAGHYLATGRTKLAGYSLCLSVIASTIPKSKKTALATILAPILLGMAPTLSRPSVVSQLYFRTSSDLLTDTTDGILGVQTPRLFSRTHWPLLPSLKDKATGVLGSFVRVAHPDATNAVKADMRYFFMAPHSPNTVLNQRGNRRERRDDQLLINLSIFWLKEAAIIRSSSEEISAFSHLGENAPGVAR